MAADGFGAFIGRCFDHRKLPNVHRLALKSAGFHVNREKRQIRAEGKRGLIMWSGGLFWGMNGFGWFFCENIFLL